jgi:hypothetical protein
MADEYKSTGLWMRSMGAEHCDSDESIIQLRACYASFRDSQLTAQISRALPDLTIHDATHLDALWETADLIAGANYPLNPLEGFVFGGAILLHDAALCFEAYEGGKNGLRQTVEWRDCFAAEKEADPLAAVEKHQSAADFLALRALHAEQAGFLGERAWLSEDKNQFYLIDNYDLRHRFGSLIGLIASSHNWPIEQVNSLAAQVNAPGTFPREWRVDAVKIACLLRCADAAHIDNRRAPDFLYALARRQGLSGDHWKAQNWLARADVDQSDLTGASLLFTSNRDFTHVDVDAWWVAYDAVCLVDREIAASNKLLAARPQRDSSPQFKVRKVLGAGAPETMSEYIRARGWQPCSAQLHVGNIERLVTSLGGKNLYGDSDQFSIVLRELIQNARDSVVARRELTRDFAGKIVVRLMQSAPGSTYLVVEDDGVGMSERVLTGPLLDFGTSFWISDLVRKEFPGLKSSKFRPVGRFGIGFYSIFMVASEVTVCTRPWDGGIGDVRTLSFPNGLTLRPTLSKGFPNDYNPSIVTRISCRLKQDVGDSEQVKVRPGRMGQADFNVSLPNYIAALVAGLDVAVEYYDRSERRILVHEPPATLTAPESRKSWLESISFSEHSNNSATSISIRRHFDRLRFLKDEQEIYGLAALSAEVDQSANFLSVATVGGLATTVHSRDSSRY